MIVYVYIAVLVISLLNLSTTLRYKQRWQRSAAHDRSRYGFDIGADLGVMSMAACIMGIGLVMVFSASYTKSNQEFGVPYYFLKRQAIFIMLGLAVMWVTSHINYRFWKPSSVTFWLLSWFGLLLVFVNGRSIKGAKRWLDLGFTNLQPVELVKVALILAVCRVVSDLSTEPAIGLRAKLARVIPLIGLAMIPAITLLFQPDYGSVLIMITIAFTAYFLVGGAYLALLYTVIGGGSLGVIMVVLLKSDHITKRITDYLAMRVGDKEPDYNILQALVSFGSGQVTGQGIGRSSQRNFFLPEAHTDFIFDIYGEETGLLGVLLLVSLYFMIFRRGLTIARRAPTPFGGLVASIISLLFFTQALINMMMAIGLLPAKGLTLPLMSYGGSSLIIVCAMLGILLNISRRPSPLPDDHPLMRFGNMMDFTQKLNRGART